jgi:hypothetical protein
LPDVADALAAGEIGFDHAQRLTACARRHPELAARDEAVLLDQARTLDADAFRLVARHWAAIADDGADAPAEGPPPRHSSLHLSPLADGWHAIDGLLSPEHGESLRAALDESVDRQLRAQRDGDPSLERFPLSAMRAEALADVVAQHQRRPPSDRQRMSALPAPPQLPPRHALAGPHRTWRPPAGAPSRRHAPHHRPVAAHAAEPDVSVARAAPFH